jgi:L-lactate utilization protein LutB
MGLLHVEAETAIYLAARSIATMGRPRLSPATMLELETSNIIPSRTKKSGNCSFVCPSRIDLKGTMLRAKAALRTRL